MSEQHAQLVEIAIEALPASVVNALEGIDRLLYFSLPLKNKFRRVTEREGLLLRGPSGWAEVSPFWDYGDQESAQWLRAGLEAAHSQPLSNKRQAVPVNATVPVVQPDVAYDIVKNSGGARTVKVKVADPQSSLAQDCARIEAVRDALGKNGSIRVDANGAWDPSEALDAIRQLDRAAQSGGSDGLEYVEQPCPSVEELARVRRQVDVPIAADESVRRAADPLAVARAQAADIVVVKVQPLGGAKRVVDVVSKAGLPAVVSSALDSSVGLARGVECAAALDELPYACGFATAQMFHSDVTKDPLLPIDGVIVPREIQIDEDAVTFLPSGVQAQRLSMWVTRLEEMAQAL